MDYQLGPGPLQVDQNTIDEKIKGDIGIVENGDIATHAITSGYYVIWKGNLYVAKTDISSGTTLSAASNGNLTAKPNGLGAEVAALNSNFASHRVLVRKSHKLGAMNADAYGYSEVSIQIPSGYKTTGLASIALGHPGAAGGLVITGTLLSGLTGTKTMYLSYYTHRSIIDTNSDVEIFVECIKDEHWTAPVDG